jgi:hypothetical protein
METINAARTGLYRTYDGVYVLTPEDTPKPLSASQQKAALRATFVSPVAGLRRPEQVPYKNRFPTYVLERNGAPVYKGQRVSMRSIELPPDAYVRDHSDPHFERHLRWFSGDGMHESKAVADEFERIGDDEFDAAMRLVAERLVERKHPIVQKSKPSIHLVSEFLKSKQTPWEMPEELKPSHFLEGSQRTVPIFSETQYARFAIMLWQLEKYPDHLAQFLADRRIQYVIKYMKFNTSGMVTRMRNLLSGRREAPKGRVSVTKGPEGISADAH